MDLRLRELAPLVVLLALALAPGCTAADYERDADRAVEEILSDRTERTLGRREETVAHPAVRAPAPPAAAQPGDLVVPAEAAAPAPAKPPRKLNLRDALAIAIESNREHIAQKEALYVTALGLTGTQYAFSPRVAAALAYTFGGDDSGAHADLANLSASVAQRLPWGGEASITAGSSFATSSDPLLPNLFDSSVAIRLTQPLLRDAGHEVAWEALKQAERSVIYAIREFELFRENFSIDVASRFYNLVEQKQGLENQRRNLEDFVFGRKQAEALFSVGRTSELEVLRARRSELTSQNSLIEAEEGFRLALDRFRIFLGLPDTEAVDVQNEEPAFVSVDYDVESAVSVALENRLDWLNRREQLEDAERGVRIAKNGLLPDLTLSLGYDVSAPGDRSFAHQGLDDGSYSAGLSLGIPLQRVNERNSYRAAQIGLARATRFVAQFKDDLVVSVRSTFRELERRKQSLEIQAQLITDQEKNVKIAQLRFDQGNFSNRDVVEAQQALLDAQNALIREKVGYEIARLGLLRDLGILFIDAKGMWKE